MTKKQDKLHLTANISHEFNTNITVGKDTFHVQTEDSGSKSPVVSTHIYHKGEILYSKKTDCSNILNTENYAEKLSSLMEKQHKDAIDEFTKKHEENRKKTEFFDAAKKLIARGNNKQALKILKEALMEYPEDQFVRSYYGYLTATVEKRYDEGIKICKKALENLGPIVSPDQRFIYTMFYLNLGRAYLAGGEKKLAIEAFNNGLRVDKSNHDLLWELKKLGTRKKPPISFLSRNNLLNKYLGKLQSKLKKD